MMELPMDMEAEHLAGRVQDRLWHCGGAGAGPPAPAGPAARGRTGQAGAHPAPRKEGGLMTASTPTTRLQQLIHRTDRVFAGMHAPTAAHAWLMKLAGADVAFV